MRENDDRQKKGCDPALSELSTIWQELLGAYPTGGDESTETLCDETFHGTFPSSDSLLGRQELYRQAMPADEGMAPTLDGDPWRELLQNKGVEVVDLQKIRLQMSDQEVEQLLQHMEELPNSDAQQQRPGTPGDQ